MTVIYRRWPNQQLNSHNEYVVRNIVNSITGTEQHTNMKFIEEKSKSLLTNSVLLLIAVKKIENGQNSSNGVNRKHTRANKHTQSQEIEVINLI
jgi:hypothetical protein